MFRYLIVLAFCFYASVSMSQGRRIAPATLETTYSYTQIHKTLRDLVDANSRPAYFDEKFFNAMLKKTLQDQRFSLKEKVQIFYLMQKKLGYSFVGIQFLPPKQNYYEFHVGKAFTLQQTRADLKDLGMDIRPLIELADTSFAKDPILASNAILLATILNSKGALGRIRELTRAEFIMASVNPSIVNHYACVSASLSQDSVVVRNLTNNLKIFTNEEMLEDVFCALYTEINPVVTMREYILAEKNQENDLSIQTALCALAGKVPDASVKESTRSLVAQSKEKWKTDLLKTLLSDGIPFHYSLSSDKELVTKTWDGVHVSVYNDGTLITNGNILEFDAN